jgi:polyhydroxybutyrate depolymerase
MTVNVDGQQPRTALLHLPSTAAPMPLIIALHATSGQFMEGYSGLSRLGDRGGFAVLYPDAIGRHWGISGSDIDVRFLDALLGAMLRGGCFDQERISVVGVSNGGGMAARFTCQGHVPLAALVAVAGGYGSIPRCAATRLVSVLEIHGTADAVVPYRGRGPAAFGDVVGWLDGWVYRDGCARWPRRRWLRTHVMLLTWPGCRGGTTVQHLRLLGGEHAWPGADPPDRGPDLGISASTEIVRFLADRRTVVASSGGAAG